MPRGQNLKKYDHSGPTYLTRKQEYWTWAHIKSRCLSETCKDWKDYGGRGISVCHRWVDSFENFFNDMGPKPSNLHMIERIDNNGNYEPSNCKWALISEQASNRRNVRKVVVDGVAKTISQWARDAGIRPGTALQRIYRGVDISEAIRSPRVNTRTRTEKGRYEKAIMH